MCKYIKKNPLGNQSKDYNGVYFTDYMNYAFIFVKRLLHFK